MRLEERYRLKTRGYDLDKLAIRVSSVPGEYPEQVRRPGKCQLTIKARSLWCYWTVGKLGFSATELVKKPGISQSSVSISVKRVEKITIFEQLELVDERKLYFYDVPNIHYRRNYVI